MGSARDRLRHWYRRARRVAKKILRPRGGGAYLLSGRTQPSLEIHVPISPTPRLLNMVHCLALSLRRNGGAYREAPIIVNTGDRVRHYGLADRLPWLKPCGVELRWLEPEEFRRFDYFATGHQRLKYNHAADVVLLIDADILIAGPLDELIEAVFAEQVIAGVIAHMC